MKAVMKHVWRNLEIIWNFIIQNKRDLYDIALSDKERRWETMKKRLFCLSLAVRIGLSGCGSADQTSRTSGETVQTNDSLKICALDTDQYLTCRNRWQNTKKDIHMWRLI